MIKESTQEDIVTIIYMYALNTGGLQYIVNTCIVKVAQSCPTLCDPMDYTVHGILQARILEWVAFPFSRDLPNPGIKPRSLALRMDSSPAEPRGKPKNIGVGSLSLFQQIFPTQKSNWGLLHCRQILYQLSLMQTPKSIKSSLSFLYHSQANLEFSK